MIKKAYAKINLGLRILNKRPDGYHNIESILHYINWYDELTFTESDHFSFDCSDISLPKDETNLVVKAVRLVEQSLNKEFKYRIFLQKNIPHGAGLGGGSSDAAAVFRFAVNHVGLPIELSFQLASQLGSDIPFFLSPETQLATETGTILKPVNYRIPFFILTIFPNQPINTKWAYSQIKPLETSKLVLLQSLSIPMDSEQFKNIFINSFQDPVVQFIPDLQEIRDHVSNMGAVYHSLSGSGSAYYACFKSMSQVEMALKKIPGGFPVSITYPDFIPEI